MAVLDSFLKFFKRGRGENMGRKTFEMLSESLTPSDVKNKEFKRVPLGYSAPQVVEFLDSVSRCWEKVQRREKESIEEIRTLNEEIDTLNSREGEIEKIRAKAHEEALAIREQGRQEAERYFLEAKNRSEGIRVKTEEWLATIISQVEETERRRNSFLTAFKAALDQHYELLNSDIHQNEGLDNQLSGFLSAMSKLTSHGELPSQTTVLVTENGKLIS